MRENRRRRIGVKKMGKGEGFEEEEKEKKNREVRSGERKINLRAF